MLIQQRHRRSLCDQEDIRELLQLHSQASRPYGDCDKCPWNRRYTRHANTDFDSPVLSRGDSPVMRRVN